MNKNFPEIRKMIESANVKRVPAHTLAPHPKNDFARMPPPQWRKFVESVKNLGVIHPVIIDTRHRVLSGMQRTLACAELNMLVPVIRIPVTDDQTAREIIIILNLASRQIREDQFNSLWNELYGERVKTELEAGANPEKLARQIAEESGTSINKAQKRVMAVLHESLQKKFKSIDSMHVLPAARRAELKALTKKAQAIHDRIDADIAEYRKIRKQITSIVNPALLDLPEVSLQKTQDKSGAVTGLPRVSAMKTHVRQKKLLRRTR